MAYLIVAAVGKYQLLPKSTLFFPCLLDRLQPADNLTLFITLRAYSTDPTKQFHHGKAPAIS